ncbi:NUDIX hydrolase [[Clostridium] polysaccharolyticum]|uniref:8-oxo-dGTP diphosphatase n=1 Tax=[Clostridium] polysaccharolyticum TaxID=29364 RepID=A0A1H9Y3M0_9FIRM|nr:8-oxo-dGTP diphosphatase [[Clostridium] polysaccharolyticum]SES63444.1 8-oxo-dGTP diphosphatase [[Clostridium] polysaccharolyticum]
MKLTALCYIEKEEQYLMLHRVSKKHDPNKDKWIGVGGRFEENESPEECMLREVKEETGLELTKYRYRGLITFVSDQWETEYMHLFTGTDFEGAIKKCEEGKLEWIPKNELLSLNIWEGDKIFLELLQKENRFFTVKLEYIGEILHSSSVKVW